MIMMEVTMNLCDWIVTGGATLNWLIIPPMLIIGFLSAWPYNYWRLKKYNEACH